ncbi:5-deoxy-glucuronate isomerase [Alteromonas lipotrueae]|uniref:5-deoxy-glucuronate isomerase n=1 Tax=Alteromonas lipotrueae TaxID=2803814 RepID=UPI001C494ACE|nr:5-deoxy-glucuronate isomerase [Alteromonas lipotrueae]
MSHLHIRPKEAGADKRIINITPESANWQFVGFEVVMLEADDTLVVNTQNTELCAVIISGVADVTTQEQLFSNIGHRASAFDGIAPYAVYAPPKQELTINALTSLEVALCRAPAKGLYPVKLITPQDCVTMTRGSGTNLRHIRNIMMDNVDAERLLITEVITPSGHWSSYPPHKHDTDAIPQESALEETYYHKLNPKQGFAFQRVYTDDRSIDETISVEHNSVVTVPKGYHPVGTPHGYELYYLNVMAGPKREWIFHNDPDHAWIVNQ